MSSEAAVSLLALVIGQEDDYGGIYGVAVGYGNRLAWSAKLRMRDLSNYRLG